MSDDSIQDVANMIKASGANRAQRKRLERSLRKTQNIMNHVQGRVNLDAYKQYEKAVEQNYLHFFAILALTCGEDYKWQENETKDQISSMLERVDKKIKKMASLGYTTEQLLDLVDEKYEIRLVPEVK